MITLLKKSSLLMLLLALAGYGIGCSDNNDSLSIDEESIQQEIETDEEELYGIDIMGEEDPSSFANVSESEGLAKSLSPIDPFAYGRKLRNRVVERHRLRFEFPEQGIAIAVITYRLRGQFVIRTRDTSTHTRGFYFKPFDHMMQRKVRFMRNPDSTAERKWLRTGMTLAYGVSEGGTLSLTGPVTIKLTHVADSSEDTYTIADPLNYYFTDQNSIPTIKPGDEVHIEMAIANSNADDAPYGIVHRGRNRSHLGRVKTIFNDEGLDGDAAAGDGVYTVEWTVENNGVTGNHIGVLDFFTHSTIFDDTAPYNSLVVALPYNKAQ